MSSSTFDPNNAQNLDDVRFPELSSAGAPKSPHALECVAVVDVNELTLDDCLALS